MKRYLVLLPLCLFTLSVLAQDKPIKVVFDVTSKDESAHQSTMRHVKMMSEAYPDSEFEVVVYGGALDMVLKDESSVAEDLELVQDNQNVSVKVCEGTMKRRQVDEASLLPGVSTVPDGIVEIVTKQGEGWGYIKEAHN